MTKELFLKLYHSENIDDRVLAWNLIIKYPEHRILEYLSHVTSHGLLNVYIHQKECLICANSIFLFTNGHIYIRDHILQRHLLYHGYKIVEP